MSKTIKTTLAAAILAVSALQASAAPLFSDSKTTVANQTMIEQVRNRRNRDRRDYNRCASFSIRVYNACLSQAGSNSQKIRSCRANYQGNVVRCQQLL